MEQLPKIARERLAQQHAESEHPAADVLAGFIERSLGVDERQRVLTHLAHCTDCRDALALAIPDELAVAPVNVTPQRRAWYEWSLFRFGGLAAALTVIVVAVLLVRPHARQAQDASAPAQAGSASATLSPGPVAEPTTQTPTSDKTLRDESLPASRAQSTEERDRITATLQKKETATESTKLQNEKQAGDAGTASKLARLHDEPIVVGGAVASNIAVPSHSAKDAKTQLQKAQTSQQRQDQQAQSFDQLESNSAASQQASTPAPPPPAPPSRKEEVTVTAAAPAISTMQAEVSPRSKVKPAPAEAERSRLGRGPLKSVASALRWTISTAGTVQRSADNGAHWQDVSIAEGAKVRTLAVGDSGVWAGGSALYHTNDLGEHWDQVTVGNEGQSMEGEITRIDLPSVSRIDLQTSAGQKWTSNDGGHTWKLQ